jgi:hypothetical protein
VFAHRLGRTPTVASLQALIPRSTVVPSSASRVSRPYQSKYTPPAANCAIYDDLDSIQFESRRDIQLIQALSAIDGQVVKTKDPRTKMVSVADNRQLLYTTKCKFDPGTMKGVVEMKLYARARAASDASASARGEGRAVRGASGARGERCEGPAIRAANDATTTGAASAEGPAPAAGAALLCPRFVASERKQVLLLRPRGPLPSQKEQLSVALASLALSGSPPTYSRSRRYARSSLFEEITSTATAKLKMSSTITTVMGLWHDIFPFRLHQVFPHALKAMPQSAGAIRQAAQAYQVSPSAQRASKRRGVR